MRMVFPVVAFFRLATLRAEPVFVFFLFFFLESRRSFELAAAQTSRLVNLVFSRQTGCF